MSRPRSLPAVAGLALLLGTSMANGQGLIRATQQVLERPAFRLAGPEAVRRYRQASAWRELERASLGAVRLRLDARTGRPAQVRLSVPAFDTEIGIPDREQAASFVDSFLSSHALALSLQRDELRIQQGGISILLDGRLVGIEGVLVVKNGKLIVEE